MSTRYSHLLSPLRIGNIVLKNRMLSSNASPHFLQGPETFPAEGFLAYNTNLAKNGAAVVTIADWANPNQRKVGMADSLRMQSFDMNDPSVHNYFSQLADDIHFFGSKLFLSLRIAAPSGYEFSPSLVPGPFGNAPGKELPAQMVSEMIDTIVEKIKVYQEFGYDGVSLRIETFLSANSNKRKDEYGGSFENRARFPLQLFSRIKERLGRDFLIESIFPGEKFDGYSLDNAITFARMAEGIIDIMQLRHVYGGPTGYNSQPGKQRTIPYAEAVKKSGAKVFIEPAGGFQDLDQMEVLIASGKADLISVSRAFMCDPEYGNKAYEGRGEDVVPCLWCAKCHGTMSPPWLSFCSVNPVMGIEHKLGRMVQPPVALKKVAVIGGGPAGMEAAIVATRRGHKVTLYEQNNILGGQLIHGNYPSFKWPVKQFKDYLIRQIGRLNVDVNMETKATPDMIRSGGFDAIIAALGAEPNTLDIPGLKESQAWIFSDVYGREKELGKHVVIIGGSQMGVETGMYLAENGHQVTVLTRQDKIAHDASPLHNITMAWVSSENGKETMRPAWEALENFTSITQATTTALARGKVTFLDADGNSKDIIYDNIVVCGGMSARQVEALSFAGIADMFFLIGDCNSVGNIQKCMRSAFGVASQI